MSVASHFQAARFDVGHAIDFVVVEEPGWQMWRRKAWISRRAAEEKYFLAGGEDALAEEFGENLTKPRAAGKHELSCGKCAAAGCGELGDFSAAVGRDGVGDQEFGVFLSCLIHHQLYGAPGQQYAAARFEQAAADAIEIHLGITFRESRVVHHFMRNAAAFDRG